MKNIRIEIKWAFFFVLMLLAWMYLEKMFGFHDKHIDKHHIITNFVAIPAILVFYFALRDKRKNYYNGVMSYKQGFISGLLITFFVTFISPLTQMITSTVITPEYFPNVIEYSVSKGFKTQDEAEAYFNLGNYIVQGLIGAPIMGIITTAIVALFTMKRK
jgi:hypothetical protein